MTATVILPAQFTLRPLDMRTTSGLERNILIPEGCMHVLSSYQWYYDRSWIFNFNKNELSFYLLQLCMVLLEVWLPTHPVLFI